MTPAASSGPRTYCAFLGNHPSLSLAELFTLAPDMTVRRRVSPQTVIVSSPVPLTNAHVQTLGGLFLLAEEIPGERDLRRLPLIAAEQMKGVKGKATFSIRAYGVDHGTLHRLYRDVKQHLKKLGVPSRYIGNEKKPPVSAQLHDEGLITGKGGCELVVLADDEGSVFWIGRTVGTQDPDKYTKRDMEKPVRDTRAGLLPPKLAQMLLNLGGWAVRETHPKPPKHLTVLDPFCGTGVIPVEALLKGWPVLASDLSQKAVNGCEKNMDWIRKEEKILKKDTPSDVWKQDATKPFDLKKLPDVVVTESMLGPALDDRPTAKDAAKHRAECDALESAFLQNAATTLPNVPIVMTFPVWYVKAGPIFLEQVWKKMADIGFEAVLPPGIDPDVPGRTSLIYRRPDQFVGREVVILKPVQRT